MTKKNATPRTPMMADVVEITVTGKMTDNYVITEPMGTSKKGPLERWFEKARLKTFKQNKDRIRAVIEIPNQSSDTFGADMRDMLEQKLTFSEAVASENFSLMSRQRLSMVRKVVYERLDSALAA